MLRFFIKYLVLLIVAYTLFVLVSYFISSTIEESAIQMQKDLQNINSKHINQARGMVSDLKKEFTISSPNKTTKVSTYQYTQPRKSKVSSQDKDCNDAIFKTMSDKSEEAKVVKKELCAHNFK